MDKLNILWTTTNKDTIKNMIAMYAINAMKNSWWKEINVIIWGGSAKVVGEDDEVKALVKQMLEVGITVEACLSCSDQFGVTAQLEEIGLKPKFMGEPLTAYLKNNEKILTF